MDVHTPLRTFPHPEHTHPVCTRTNTLPNPPNTYPVPYIHAPTHTACTHTPDTRLIPWLIDEHTHIPHTDIQHAHLSIKTLGVHTSVHTHTLMRTPITHPVCTHQCVPSPQVPTSIHMPSTHTHYGTQTSVHAHIAPPPCIAPEYSHIPPMHTPSVHAPPTQIDPWF